MCKEYAISDVLTAFGYDGYNEDSNIQLNIKEIDLVEKYHFISEYSPERIETVNYMLNREHQIAKQIKEDKANNSAEFAQELGIPSRSCVYLLDFYAHYAYNMIVRR